MVPSERFSRVVRSVAAAVLALSVFLVPTAARAQIKDPGDHPKYGVELEPHFVVQWDDNDWGDDGIGIGGRVSIPLMDNGPIPSINNNIAIGFGLDWAHFGGDCWGYYYRGVPNPLGGVNCSSDDIWVPVVAQWNFFFTPVVSAFGELGLGFQHESTSLDCSGPVSNGCGISRSRNYLEPLFAVGPRFMVANSFAIVLRIGVPYFSAGVSFLL
jgi:hypothetical protein